MGPARVVLPLQTWLAASHLTALGLSVLILIGTGALATDLRNQTRWDLEHQGAILALHAAERVRLERQHTPGAQLSSMSEDLSALLRATKQATLAGIRITDPQGVVVATSGDVLGEDLSRDHEVAAALSGRTELVIRPRPAIRAPLASQSRRAQVRLFVAVPVQLKDELLGTVVLSRTPREELQALYHMAPGLLLGAGVSLAATLMLALLSGFVLSRSLGVLARGADRIAEGAFDGLAQLEDPAGSHVAEVASVAGSVATMTARLRDRLGYIAEFASHVSHEFKTPLATLRGTVELLQDDDAMPPEQRARFLRNARTELDRLDRLVSGLLGLARADQGGERTEVDLDALLARVADRYGLTVQGRAAQVLGDPVQIEAVADNLVQNALRYGEQVVVRGFGAGDVAGFAVEDDGPGISPANLPRVFDRFFTTDRGSGGTGLGLALARAIVDRHGGEITVESAPGRTVFRVGLPKR